MHDNYRTQVSHSSEHVFVSTAIRRTNDPWSQFSVRMIFSVPCGDPAMASYWYTAWLVQSHAEAGALTKRALARRAEIEKAWLSGDESRLDTIIQEIEDETGEEEANSSSA